ncbi:NADAR family protein [Micromonospora zhanjiangensis]|uniref:NADAR family protein n=1 Tax=Micromonospora zhanjiangensis TaxID=1522057 RepID=A0ABV8KUK2_9ACTN
MSETRADPRDLTDLRRRLAAGDRIDYLYFWGHRPRRDGAAGPHCLSQWWPAPFVVDDIRYASAEHYMMAHKAWLFGDDTVARQILDASSPGAAKALGAQVREFDEATWQAHRFDIVVAGSEAKFGQHPKLAAYLTGTRGRVLVEASPVDRIWGIGLAADDPRAADPDQWPGLNLLGFALMRARDRLCG